MGKKNNKKKKRFNKISRLIKNEPKPLCTICDKEIEAISIAISDGENNFKHFDCVLKSLGENKDIKENQKISYIGRGNFALVEKNEGKWTIIETFNLETPEAFACQKKYIQTLKEEVVQDE